MQPDSPSTNLSANNKSKKINMRLMAVGVVVLIAVVLAIIAGLYYWQKNTVIATVKDELKKVVPAMESEKSKTGAYPITIANILAASSDKVKLTGSSSFDGTSYCITGKSTSDESIIFHINSAKVNDGPQTGSCETGSDIPAPSAPGGIAVDFASSSEIKVSWNAAIYATGYTLQCSTDSGFKDPISVETSDTTGTCGNLKSNTVYYYRVKATNNVGDSAWPVPSNISTSI